MTDYRFATLDHVRATIARAMIDEADTIPPCVGTITLRTHQRAAAARLVSLISMTGGAMLAERVGLGKTYTALAVAARFNEHLLIAAPAALRTMWTTALTACGVSGTLVTHEALSRGERLDHQSGVIIVDEAHRLRTPTTKRYSMLADACRRAKVLLVTATPVQNRRADLATLLALYLGRVAWEMTDEELARHVVRDASAATIHQPRLNGPHRVTLDVDDDCLDALLALPPPVPARDESLAVALQTYGLVHQWTSSRAALVASLTRRRARGVALLAAVESGRRPTRAELAAWTHDESVVQLAFPELVTSQTSVEHVELSVLAESLRRHDDAVANLLVHLRSLPDPDRARAAALLAIRRDHPAERIIAFCQYTETVHALRSALAGQSGVAALTAHGARIAGGRISRDEIIAQFAPRVPTADRFVDRAVDHIDLLITTDLLSEGLNLQEASVIVHLDLPWNPARLDQRVGRARRLGSRHDVVSVYSFSPPAAAERLLRIETRLRDKLSVAQKTVGVAGHILPSPIGAEPEGTAGFAEEIGEVNALIRDWLRLAPPSVASDNKALVSAVHARRPGFVALVRDADGPQLVADVGFGIQQSAPLIHGAVNDCNGSPTFATHTRVATVIEQLTAWLANRAAATTIDLHAATTARSRRAALARVAQAVARAPRHRRAQLVPLAAAARAVATAPMAEGAERILELLVQSELSDEAWLRSIATFGELNVRAKKPNADATSAAGIVAIILLEPSNYLGTTH